MRTSAARVVWYRSRTTLARQWGAYLSLVLLIGLIGGIAMGSVAAARRTQSAYPAFLAATNASDLTMSTYGITNNSSASNYSPRLSKEIAQLPEVRRVESWVGAQIIPLEPDGAPNLSAPLNPVGSVDGLYFDEDRATPVVGRMANPNRADEFVTTALGAHLLGLHVGEVIPMGVFTATQFSSPGFGTPRVTPERRIAMRLVGIVVFNNEVIEDDTDRLPDRRPVHSCPHLHTHSPRRRPGHLVRDATRPRQPRHSRGRAGTHSPAAERKRCQLQTSPRSPRPRSSEPSNQSRSPSACSGQSPPSQPWPSLFSPSLDNCARPMGTSRCSGRSVPLQPRPLPTGWSASSPRSWSGSVLAVVVAVLLSPLSPLGPIRGVYHPPGIAFDWTVLGLGLLVLIGGLGVTAVALAYRGAPQRLAARSRTDPARDSKLVQMASSSGLPASGVIGLRFALNPGQGRTAVPARSVLIGATIAVAIVTATLTFSSGLHTLVSRPALYGWNWNYALSSGNVVPPQALTALNHDA